MGVEVPRPIVPPPPNHIPKKIPPNTNRTKIEAKIANDAFHR